MGLAQAGLTNKFYAFVFLFVFGMLLNLSVTIPCLRQAPDFASNTIGI